MALGTDYTGIQSAPTLMTGSFLLPGTLVVAEVRPNVVTVEGADGTTAVASSAGHAAGLGRVGEYVRYSYVLDSTTLQDLADTRLQNNIQTIAASIEVAADGHWRPWVDYYVGDIIWVDIDAAGMPAGWYRVERISMRFTNEREGPRYVVDVGRAVVPEDALVADRLAAILEAGLIDLDTGLVTTAPTGQANTTVVITVDDVPAHTHVWSDVSGAPTPGGDISGTDLSTVKVERVQGREFSSGAAAAGDSIVWNDNDLIAEWRGRITFDTTANRLAEVAADLRPGDIWLDTDASYAMYVWDGTVWQAAGATPIGGGSLRTIDGGSVDSDGIVTHEWGVNASGVAYYDTAGAVVGEQAMLVYDPATGKYLADEVS